MRCPRASCSSARPHPHTLAVPHPHTLEALVHTAAARVRTVQHVCCCLRHRHAGQAASPAQRALVSVSKETEHASKRALHLEHTCAMPEARTMLATRESSRPSTCEEAPSPRSTGWRTTIDTLVAFTHTLGLFYPQIRSLCTWRTMIAFRHRSCAHSSLTNSPSASRSAEATTRGRDAR